MGTIRIEANYPHSPERVWKALTDPQAIAEWLMPNDFQARLGHRFQFRVANAKGWSGVVDCEVTRALTAAPAGVHVEERQGSLRQHVRARPEVARSC